MAFPAFLDTCVLCPAYLCDTLLRLAAAGACRCNGWAGTGQAVRTDPSQLGVEGFGVMWWV